MSVLFEISAIEKEIKNGNYNLEDRIMNLRQLILADFDDHPLIPKEAKTHALQIWNIAVKLQRTILKLSIPDQSTLRLALIPQFRILAVDIFGKYMDKSSEDDNSNFLYFLTYAYKSLIDAQNFAYADRLFETACNIIPTIKLSPDNNQSIVQLTIWKVQSELTQNNDYDEALEILQSLIAKFPIESSLLISFVYEKSVQSKSIKWGLFCHSLINQASIVSQEWKNQIDLLLTQLYLNNNEPDKAIQLLSTCPDSLNKNYLQLKCSILIDPNDEALKDKLLSFIEQTENDRRVLIALCLFVADHCNNLPQASLDFIREVVKISSGIEAFELRKFIYLSSIRISSECNDIKSAELFLQSFKNHDKFTDDEKKEMAGILWNQALNRFDVSDYEHAIEWMELSRSQMSDLDNESQACCFRFISRCYHELNKNAEALSYANDAIQRHQSNSHGYLLKFRILKDIGNEKESFDFVYNIIYNSPFLEEFESTFFTSITAELHLLGNDSLALETLLKFYELNFNKPSNSIHNTNLSTEFHPSTVFEDGSILSNKPLENDTNIGENANDNKSQFAMGFTDEINLSSENNVKKSVLNSIFAILQQTDDISCVSKAMNILASRWNSQVFYYLSDEQQDNNLIHFTHDDVTAYSSIAFNNGIEFKKKQKYGKAAKSFMAGSIFSCSLIECKAPCIYQAVDCYIRSIKEHALFQSTKIDTLSPNKLDMSQNSPICRAQRALDEIAQLFLDDTIQIEQKYKDGFILAKLKLSLIVFSQDNKTDLEITNHLVELIDDITSPAVLSEICDFICDNKAPVVALHALLERARKIDVTQQDNLSISASLLHQMILRAESQNEMKKCFELVVEFFTPENSKLVTTSQLQFFMARAWNIGIQNIKAFRFVDGEWWLKTALNLMQMNEELRSLYEDELNAKYSNFLEHSNRPIFLPF